MDVLLDSGSSNGHRVAYTDVGEWLEYGVNVQSSGTYEVAFEVGRQKSGNRALSLSSDGRDLTGEVTVPSTGGWDRLETISTRVSLKSGVQTLRLDLINGGFDIDWMELKGVELEPTRQTFGNGGNPWQVSGGDTVVVEAEFFDEGGEGVSYHESDTRNQAGGDLRPDAPSVDVSSVGIAYFDNAEWLEYTLSVAEAGTYRIDLTAATPYADSGYSIGVDGVEVVPSVAFPGTGDWNTYETRGGHEVQLAEGEHVLRLTKTVRNGLNVDSLSFTQLGVADGVAFPADAGVLDVRDFGAVGDGVTDDTSVIQAALDFEASGNRIVYLANGTYLVSDTLRWNDGASNTTGDDSKRTILQGQSENGVIIRLKDAAAGYQDPSARRAVVFTGTKPAQRFRNAVRDLTIDTGTGNAGAVGMQFIANNQGGIFNVTIRSGDGQGVVGLDMRYTDEIGPLFVHGLTVEGFDVGIDTKFQTASITLESVHLSGQNVTGWVNEGQTIFVRSLTSESGVTAFHNVRNAPSRALILDADLTYTGGDAAPPAIFNDRAMVAKGVATTGYGQAIRHDDKGRGNTPGVTGATLQGDWLSHGVGQQLFDGPRQTLGLEVRDAPVPAFDALGRWASPADFGGVEGSDADQSAALQAAIDSGATTIYLPNGVWRIDGDVMIRGSVERIIGGEARIAGSGSLTLADAAAGPAAVIVERLEVATDFQFVQGSTRSLTLSSILGGGYRNTTAGTGDLFLNDVAFKQPVTFRDQSVWARQLNHEVDTQASGVAAKITNDGADLWILGLKTEQAGTVLRTINGGRTELLGGFLFSNGAAKASPAFIVEDSEFVAFGVWEQNFNSALKFQEWVVETRDGVTRTLSNDLGTSGVYYGARPA